MIGSILSALPQLMSFIGGGAGGAAGGSALGAGPLGNSTGPALGSMQGVLGGQPAGPMSTPGMSSMPQQAPAANTFAKFGDIARQYPAQGGQGGQDMQRMQGQIQQLMAASQQAPQGPSPQQMMQQAQARSRKGQPQGLMSPRPQAPMQGLLGGRNQPQEPTGGLMDKRLMRDMNKLPAFGSDMPGRRTPGWAEGYQPSVKMAKPRRR